MRVGVYNLQYSSAIPGRELITVTALATGLAHIDIIIFFTVADTLNQSLLSATVQPLLIPTLHTLPHTAATQACLILHWQFCQA